MKGKEKEQLYQKRNYDHYRFSMKELLKYMGQALALCIMADYLFYRSAWVLLLMIPALVFYLKWQQNRMIRERRKTAFLSPSCARFSTSFSLRLCTAAENP